MEEEDGRLVAGHRKHLQGLHDQREAVQAELDGVAKPRVRQDLEVGVDAAVAQLERLQEVFQEGDPAEVRAGLREVIARVELFFDPRPRGRQMQTAFAKALIYVREDFGIVPNLGYSSSRTA
jgi:hypothetical protein